MSPIGQNDSAVWWCGPLAIDADGAPDCYGPEGTTGRDYLANAGRPGNWWGIVVGDDDQPLIQGPNDPCPGYYISTTALQDRAHAVSDPRRYVDSSTVPYISIPSDARRLYNLGVGDVALIHCQSTGCDSAAIVADIGPEGKYGEGSIKLAENLQVPSDAKHGGCSSGVTCLVFKESSRGWPRTNQDVADQVQVLVNAYPDKLPF